MTKPKLAFYLIERPDGFTGADMWVKFWRGAGLFGLAVMHVERPDWVKRTPFNTTSGYEQVAGVPLEEYLEYFQERRAWKVTEIDEAAAKAFTKQVDQEREKEERALLEKVKAKQRAKTRGSEIQAPVVQETPVDAQVKAEIAEGNLKQVAPAAPDAPPHESGAMQGKAESVQTSAKPATAKDGAK